MKEAKLEPTMKTGNYNLSLKETNYCGQESELFLL